ncbi:global nitrogen regulator protein [Rhizopus delemar RA 99-880]|uniref:Global nitrogen regulator protein n=3 Tax=Rhizopus TaxID=4842 RepID=I1BWU8_RHIO9|nr:global nitrogen regulator protein [Rhizopus delemar RA 99-880]|eukprot:EIE80678.1 global nitrogen regulator protein [Rhizopus delemar RA 99-880]
MDDCGQQPVSHVHPLQILSPSVHDTFLASFRLEENLNITQNQFSLDESRLCEEEGMKSLLFSVGDDTLSEDEENKEVKREEDDLIYKSEDSLDDDDSDWEKPKKKRQSFGSFTQKTKSRKSSFQKDDIQCYHCQTTNTPLWRRSPEGAVLCNACGLFLKLHGVVRPLSLKSDVIKKRNRTGKRQKTRKQKKQRL